MNVKMNVIDDNRLHASAGYDHDLYEFSPLPTREQFSWPGNNKAAIVILLDLRAVEWGADGSVIEVPGGRGPAAPPNFPLLSHREFGHRVGIFRLSRLLSDFDVPWASVVDVLTAEYYPAVVTYGAFPSKEIIAGGMSASRPITSLMTKEEEVSYISRTLERLERSLGLRPDAWMSPGWSESYSTPKLLKNAGVNVVLDFANDEQPYSFTGKDSVWCFPVSWELSDVAAVFDRDVDPDVYANSIIEAVEGLVADFDTGPRVLCVHLSPWLSGEGFRTYALRRALRSLSIRDDLWWATPSAVVDHVRHFRE